MCFIFLVDLSYFYFPSCLNLKDLFEGRKLLPFGWRNPCIYLSWCNTNVLPGCLRHKEIWGQRPPFQRQKVRSAEGANGTVSTRFSFSWNTECEDNLGRMWGLGKDGGISLIPLTLPPHTPHFFFSAESLIQYLLQLGCKLFQLRGWDKMPSIAYIRHISQ